MGLNKKKQVRQKGIQNLIKYHILQTPICGNELYLLQVIAHDFKQKMFGSAGGR